MPFAPEFALVAACCRWPPSPERDEAVRSAAAGIDWPLAARMARRHRVEGLVWKALRQVRIDVPDEAASLLAAAASRIARRSLGMAAECFRLERLLAAEGIAALILKGVPLGKLAYGTIGLKMGSDIDLLVLPDEVERAASVLERGGYCLATPQGPAARERLGFWHEGWKESVWVSETRGFQIDLHSRLTDNPRLLPGLDARSPRQSVEISTGLALETLATDEHFAYLCVHGASSAWFRLKWIADLAALIAPCAPEEVERLYRRSQQLGAGRAAAQALLLIEALFSPPLPQALMAELRADRVSRWLLRIALRKLSGRAAATELEDTRLGTASIHLMQLALLPGWRFKLSELGRQLVSPYDQLAVPLPRALSFLYPLVFVARRLPRPGRRGA
ncbi:MAG TPA: nucleotidyltransferase family protein [Allosphingosinicella sp.]|jgi:hypothetical protein